MAPRFVAVIDIGKTNAKLAVVDCDCWTEIAVKSIANTVLPGPPYPHFDVETIWRFLLNTLRDFASQYAIGAISITTHGATGALLDARGELAMPVLDYEFDGLFEATEAYEAVRPPFSETGAPRLPGGLNLGAQFHWQMTTFAQAASRVTTMLMYPQYWAHRLTGIAANEVTSLGCHTDLWAPWSGEYSSLVKTMGWTELFAPIRASSDVLGPISSAVAAATGLSATTPVMCGIHDSNASLYPHLLSADGPFSVVSTGTWTICMAIAGQQRQPDPDRDTLVNVSALGEPVPSARFMGGREFDVLMAGGQADYSEADVLNVLNKGIMHLPSVERGSGPFPLQTPEWIHEAAMNAGERYVAVSFYLALMTKTCLDLCGARGTIAVEGPFSRNQPYLCMLAAATDRPVVISGASATGTSIGAAMLAVPREQINAKLKRVMPTDEVAKSQRYAMAVYAGDWMFMVEHGR